MRTMLKVFFASFGPAVRRVMAVFRFSGRQGPQPACDWNELVDARRRFHWEREHLEARFIELAQADDKRPSPRWRDCRFEDQVTYALNRRSRRLLALVAVVVTPDGRRPLENDPSWRALPEELIAQNRRRNRSATAIFMFDGKHWTTEGTTVFNFDPAALAHVYQRELELLADEPTATPRTS